MRRMTILIGCIGMLLLISFAGPDLRPTEARSNRVRPTRMDGPSEIRGRVVDEDGAPIAGAHVIHPERCLIGDRGELSSAEGREGAAAVTDAQGRFTIPFHCRSDETPTLLVSHPGYVLTGAEATVTPGISEPNEIHLQRGGTVRGHLARGPGWIRVYALCENRFCASSDVEGSTFELPSLPEGRATLWLERQGVRSDGPTVVVRRGEVTSVDLP